MDFLMEYWPFLIPLALIELGLLAASLIHIFTHKTYRFGSRILWIILCVLVNIIGPVLYFCLGRSDEGKGGE